jgi:hypothetical protein
VSIDEVPCDYLVQGPWCQRVVWRQGSQENFSPLGLRAPMTQVGEDRLGGFLQQGQFGVSLRLGVPDPDKLVSPVDILQTQRH